MYIDHSLPRCDWCRNTFDEYIHYHDHEWGVPVYDDLLHFEFLILESAQAGLSWSTVLKRRQGYRKSFAGFDPGKVARFDETKINSLLNDVGIIRNRQKIYSSINNAKQFIKIQEEFGSFNHYIWRFVNGEPIVNAWKTKKQVPATSQVSDQLSKDLKERGFTFIGSTIIYAHMQATGLVNDHLVGCFRYKELS
jgi:DNA-3-methyladenine glycosylase I